jgi:hypothetical protein
MNEFKHIEGKVENDQYYEILDGCVLECDEDIEILWPNGVVTRGLVNRIWDGNGYYYTTIRCEVNGLNIDIPLYDKNLRVRRV